MKNVYLEMLHSHDLLANSYVDYPTNYENYQRQAAELKSLSSDNLSALHDALKNNVARLSDKTASCVYPVERAKERAAHAVHSATIALWMIILVALEFIVLTADEIFVSTFVMRIRQEIRSDTISTLAFASILVLFIFLTAHLSGRSFGHLLVPYYLKKGQLAAAKEQEFYDDALQRAKDKLEAFEATIQLDCQPGV